MTQYYIGDGRKHAALALLLDKIKKAAGIGQKKPYQFLGSSPNRHHAAGRARTSGIPWTGRAR